MIIEIQTYDHAISIWYTTYFSNREELLSFLLPLFKEPGKYEFDISSKVFNERAREFNKHGFYTDAPYKSADFVEFWDTEKKKCINGIIVKNGNKIWYLPGEYYMWLNFLPIYDKEEKKFGFAKVRDAQYHIALYEKLAELSNKHIAILKKRQCASTYFHTAKLINKYWFFQGFVGKIAASLKQYIDDKGAWRFLDEYKNFLNANTAWYRHCNPERVLNWEQKIEVTVAGKKKDVGLRSVLLGYSTEKDTSAGVAGATDMFYHEEAGIAPNLSETLEYLLPALKSGMIYTGLFIAAGSVGSLDQCEGLKELILNPDSKDVYKVRTNLLDEKGTEADCGLFVPEQWSMLPCIDEYGNSLVEDALKMITEERKKWKEELTPDKYQLRISQKPTNIKEAFAYREVSIFPIHIINAQIERIKDKEYFLEYLDIYRNESNKIIVQPSSRTPIKDFPISANMDDKRSVLVVHERPDPNAKWGTYLASIDPVSEGSSRTSQSLCSIYVYKTSIEKITHKSDGKIESEIEQDKLVAWWCGRYDDLNQTHEMLELIIEWYNAWTLVENNVSLFIQHMMNRNKQKYLVTKDQILFLKELSGSKVSQDYGWRNVGSIFKSHLLSYSVQSVTEEIDHITKPDGTVVKIHYGVERIPDIMLLKEMLEYKDKLNVDRLVAYSALVAFAIIQKTNRGYVKQIEYETKLQNESKNVKFKMSPFRNIGNTNSQSSSSIRRSPFKIIK